MRIWIDIEELSWNYSFWEGIEVIEWFCRKGEKVVGDIDVYYFKVGGSWV